MTASFTPFTPQLKGCALAPSSVNSEYISFCNAFRESQIATEKLNSSPEILPPIRWRARMIAAPEYHARIVRVEVEDKRGVDARVIN